MVYGFIERIERSVMTDEGRCVVEILRDTCAACRAELHFEIAAAKPDIEPANARRQWIKFDLSLGKFIHDFTEEVLNS